MATHVVVLSGKELEGNPARARLQSDAAAVRRRNAHRAAGVRSFRKWDALGDHGSGGAARRAARRVLRIPRIARDAPQRAVREAGEGELRRGRLAHHDAARAAQTLHHERVIVGHPILVGVRAEGRGLALGGREVLDGDGHPVQRAHLIARGDRALRLARLLDGLVRVGEAEAVERGVDPPRCAPARSSPGRRARASPHG